MISNDHIQFRVLFWVLGFGGIYRRCGIALYKQRLGLTVSCFTRECTVYVPSGSLWERQGWNFVLRSYLTLSGSINPLFRVDVSECIHGCRMSLDPFCPVHLIHQSQCARTLPDLTTPRITTGNCVIPPLHTTGSVGRNPPMLY
jgi:hypothetical protein